MSKYKAAIAELAKIQKALGVKFANADEMARALAKERAAAAGLPDVVFHGSPHAFSEFNVGDDYFRHVAPDPLVAAQRIKDLNIPVSERKFNISPEDAQRLGFSPEDLKGGFVHEIRTNLGKPLRVKDPGFFDLDRLLEDPAILSALSPEDLKLMQDRYKVIEQKQLELMRQQSTQYFTKDPKTLEQITQLQDEIKNLEKEGINFLGESLQKQGYGSLQYKNTAEVPKQYKQLHSAYLEIDGKISAIDDALRNVTNPEQAKKLQQAKAELTGVLKELEEQFPDSYALFHNTPVRNILADMDPTKLKSHPGSLTKNIAIAAGAGTAAAALAPEESEAGVLTNLDDIAKAVSKVKNPDKKTIQQVLGISNPKTEKDIGEAVLSYKNLLDYVTREKLGMKMGDRIEKVNDKVINTFYPYYELDKDTIAGLYDGRIGRKELINKFMSLDTSKRSFAEKYKDAVNEANDSLGVFFHEPVANFPYNINTPKGIFLQDNSPPVLKHELQHELDLLSGGPLFNFVNSSYIFENPLTNSFIDKNYVHDNLLRLVSTSEDEKAFDRILKNLKKKGIEPERVYDPENTETINKYVKNSLRQKPDRLLDFGIGNHFLDYKNFELERALELLNEKVKMPSVNPIIRKKQLKQLEQMSPNNKEATKLLDEVSKNQEMETIPLRELDFQKRKYQDQMNNFVNSIVTPDEIDEFNRLSDKFGDLD